MSDVASTAAVIAHVRADESAKPASERLFSDPFAHLFVGDSAATEILDRYGQVPFFREHVVVRTRFIDDALRAALARGVRRLVLLGAGFDCRALRIPEVAVAGALVLEVDFSRQLEQKRKTLSQAGHPPPEWNKYIACDFTADGFEATLGHDLRMAGCGPRDQTFVIWEGVVNYLEPNDVDRTLRFIAAETAPGSAIAFNYIRLRLDPESLPARLASLGFSEVRTWPLVDLYRRYYHRDPSGDAWGAANEFYISVGTV